jgi:acetyl-CoA acetyltransferase
VGFTAAALRDQAIISGVSQVDFVRGAPESTSRLAGLAIAGAIEDAGLKPSDLDGIVVYGTEETAENEVAREFGLGDLSFFCRIPGGGGAGCGLVGHAVMAIAAGQAGNVLVYRARKGTDTRSRHWLSGGEIAAGERMWIRPFGMVRPADEVAVLARRYMHEFGITEDHFANVAVACRRHGAANPRALLRKPITREDHHASRMISDPLRLLDCCIEADGAAALIVSPADRAPDCPAGAVYVHAFAQGISAGSTTMATFFGDDPLRTQSWACAERLWAMSELTVSDLRVAQLDDSFTPLVLLALEGYGFCGRGEAGDFSEGGNLEIGGKLAINTAGGSLADGFLHGFNHVIEGVRQMRGTSANQVTQAQACFVGSADAVPTSALILRR